jgi:outer membrane protein assembly factor BamA
MFLIMLLLPLLTYSPHQEAKSKQPTKEVVAQDSDAAPYKCSQPAAEQDALIRKAEAEEYAVRRVEFLGLERTPDRIVRRRVPLVEGDLFTRKNLTTGLENVNKLKMVYPVGLAEVELSLKDEIKVVDILICFKEKKRR